MRPIERLLRKLFTKPRLKAQPAQRHVSLMLPHEPEALASMRARWRKALWPVCDVVKLVTCPRRAYYPTDYRRHVFDTIEGFRMALSRDCVGDATVLHASFGVILPEAQCYLPTLAKARAVFRVLFQEVTGIQTQPMCEDVGERAIHWYWKEHVLWDLM